MELKTDKRHIIVKMTEAVRKRIKNNSTIVRIAAGVLIPVTILSGCGKSNKNTKTESPTISSYTEVDNSKRDSQQVEIAGQAYNLEYSEETPTKENEGLTDDAKKIIATNLNKNYTDIKMDDLLYITEISVTAHEGDDFTWLSYCKNLEKLNISEGVFNEETFGVLKNMLTLTSLSFENCDGIEMEFLYSLKQIKNLTLDMYQRPDYVDYSKLTHLTTISFAGEYMSKNNIVISLTSDAIEVLEESGVEINLSNYTREDIDKANIKLDQIVAQLGLNESSTDQEKLDAILIYVLDNLTYDPIISDSSVANNGFANVPYDLVKEYYTTGYLSEIIDDDPYALCGNYSALVTALATRVGLTSDFVYSAHHVWNVVKVNGEYYYVDATWIDDQQFYNQIMSEIRDDNNNVIAITQDYEYVSPANLIRTGETEEIHWYMENPGKDLSSIDKNNSHQTNIPLYFDIKPVIEDPIVTEPVQETQSEEDKVQETTKENDISNKKFKITINKKTWIISGSALFAILTGLGIAIPVRAKKKRREAQNRASYSRGYSDWQY